VLPSCETSLVWPEEAANPALARFVAFVRERGREGGHEAGREGKTPAH
jgi:hypothetical protein